MSLAIQPVTGPRPVPQPAADDYDYEVTERYLRANRPDGWTARDAMLVARAAASINMRPEHALLLARTTHDASRNTASVAGWSPSAQARIAASLVAADADPYSLHVGRLLSSVGDATRRNWSTADQLTVLDAAVRNDVRPVVVSDTIRDIQGRLGDRYWTHREQVDLAAMRLDHADSSTRDRLLHLLVVLEFDPPDGWTDANRRDVLEYAIANEHLAIDVSRSLRTVLDAVPFPVSGDAVVPVVKAALESDTPVEELGDAITDYYLRAARGATTEAELADAVVRKIINREFTGESSLLDAPGRASGLGSDIY